MPSFIENPETISDLENNANFQLENVKGWLLAGSYGAALIKAQCLVKTLQALESLSEKPIKHKSQPWKHIH